MAGAIKKPGTGAQTLKPPIHKAFLVQIVFLFLVSALVAWKNPHTWKAFLLGGMIQCIPNWYFARQVFKFSGAAAAQRVTHSFYRGEVGKFVLTGVGFALAFTLVENLSHPALFAGFGMMMVGHVVLVPLLNRK
jgi:ATP synthase protein I